MTDLGISLITMLAEKTIDTTLPLFKKLNTKVSKELNSSFLDYYYNMLERYNDVKTLLHRQPINFYEIYYLATLMYDSERISIDKLSNLFEKSNCITIIGDAGSGKSMLLRHLFLSSFIEKAEAPVLIPLRNLNSKNSDLVTYIEEMLFNDRIIQDKDVLMDLLESGSFIFFLDGYDEIKSEEKEKITNNLESFINKYPKNKYVLTSRPYSDIEYFKNFHNYKMANLSKSEQSSFIKMQVVSDELANKMIDSIRENKAKYIDSFLKNPLLLTLYIITYSRNSNIPTKKYHFYRRVFDVLYEEHDSATKVGFDREIKTKLTQEDLEGILKVFSFLSYFDDEFNFDKEYVFKRLRDIKSKTAVTFKNNDFIDDMKVSIGLWLEDSGIYSFSHRSLQEYFTAVYITSLSLEAKKKVYKKILQSIEDRDFMKSSRKNFLELCYEMDELFYIEYALLPMLKTLLNYYFEDFEVQYNNFLPSSVWTLDNITYAGRRTIDNIKIHNIQINLLVESDIFSNIEDNILEELDFSSNNLYSFCEYDNDESNGQIYEKVKLSNKEIDLRYKNIIGIFCKKYIENIKEIIFELENKLKNEKSNEINFVDMI